MISGGGGGITSEILPSKTGEDDGYGFMDVRIQHDAMYVTRYSHGISAYGKCITISGSSLGVFSTFAKGRFALSLDLELRWSRQEDHCPRCDEGEPTQPEGSFTSREGGARSREGGCLKFMCAMSGTSVMSHSSFFSHSLTALPLGRHWEGTA